MPQNFEAVSSQEQNLLERRQSVRTPSRSTSSAAWWRAFRLCFLAVMLPSVLVAGPLYLRYRVYYATMYPLGISDMRLINAHVSTTWCQGQTVQANTTYNAYVVNGAPRASLEPQKVSMTRQLVLEDDMKEYWAFYLMRGSSVTVSTCVRWQGASLIVIKGHRHLHECAYIGDNSSEENDELEDASERTHSGEDGSNQTNNTPDLMRRFRPGVLLDGGEAARGPSERLQAGSSSGSSDEDDLLASLLLQQATAHARLKLKPQTPHPTPAPPPTPATSEELIGDILQRIRDLGPRGQDFLQRLNNEAGLIRATTPPPQTERTRCEGGQEPQATTPHSDQTGARRRRRRGAPRMARDIVLQHAFNTDDEEGDKAIEEDLEPDGIADHHRTLNETTVGDHSNSEVWSSFSSSEEKLLECAGLVLNLPLQPHRSCELHKGHDELIAAARANTVTYKVPSNGYYFFVFSSENEIQPNFIRVHFNLEKTVYNVSQTVASCKNVTGSCSLPLGFWTSDTVVLEVPIDSNLSFGNEEYFVRSECQPRTAIYLACIIAVPLLIVLFAFH